MVSSKLNALFNEGLLSDGDMTATRKVLFEIFSNWVCATYTQGADVFIGREYRLAMALARVTAGMPPEFRTAEFYRDALNSPPWMISALVQGVEDEGVKQEFDHFFKLSESEQAEALMRVSNIVEIGASHEAAA